MIECIFTIDYEIYGNGYGSLLELVYEPARKLKRIFDQAGAKFVVFVEAAELEQIAMAKSDPAISKIEQQVLEFHQNGFEIALHLHPQWYNARYRAGRWELDYRDYNLCTLPKPRISEIVDRSLSYLRTVLKAPTFAPASFRAGNWLFQPTAAVADVLAQRGVKIDSSVFKGGLLRRHKLDYRPAAKNGFFWRFNTDVNSPDSDGVLLELPIYTQMVPFWRMLTTKRVGLQQKSHRSVPLIAARDSFRSSRHLCDYLRFRYPLKFDFCRMSLREMTRMVESVLRQDRKTPGLLCPLVAIGHTKDLMDYSTVERFLSWLKEKEIPVVTLEGAYTNCRQ